jgi:hypothetical protein
MTVRPFDWRDLPALYRYRNRGLFLDNARLLTQGPRLVPAGALFSYFAPATGIFTYRCTGNGDSSGSMLGQVIHPMGGISARLSFVAPTSALETSSLPEMIEHLTVEIGERGALHLLAEVAVSDGAFEQLRRAGFAIYSRQRIWQLGDEMPGEALSTPWRSATVQDCPDARTLYYNLVPGLVQQVEPAPNRLKGMVYCQEGEILAYVELRYGLRGILAQPFVHPDMKEVQARLGDLLRDLHYRHSRPVYLCIRSYQSWLEGAIAELGAQAGPEQAVLVKRLAIAQKATRPYEVPVLERTAGEISAPLARSTRSNCN